jgi:hypothetical protein
MAQKPADIIFRRSSCLRRSAAVTLALMVAPSIWPRGKIRLYPVLIGLTARYGGKAYRHHGEKL